MPTKRVWGENRYKTSVRVLEYAIDEISRLFVACRTNYPDALLAGSAAAVNNNLLLLAPMQLPIDNSTVECFSQPR